jgi:hypothetical protein
MKFCYVGCLATLLATFGGRSAAAQDTFVKYLGQAPPDQTPRVFSLQTHDGYYASDRIVISADGKELYYTDICSFRVPPTSPGSTSTGFDLTICCRR